MEWTATLEPLVNSLGLELYDVELTSGTLSVVVNRPGGVDLEALTKVNRTISEWLDVHDPIAGRYTLDVSSPGLERRLRTPAHFISALGEDVTLRELRPDGGATRRLEGRLVRADEQTITLEDNELGAVTISLDCIERARTVFAWGATKPSKTSDAKGAVRAKSATTSSTSRKG